MFYEYAIDPEILSNYEECKQFFLSFQSRPQHLISDAPRNWARQALNHINTIPHEQCLPARKKALKGLLAVLVKDNLTKNRPVNRENQNWLDCVVEEHQRFPFSALFGTDALQDPVPCYSFSDLVFDSPDCWSNEQQHVERVADEMVSHIRPLLYISKTIQLVDPHIRFIEPGWGRYKGIIKELLENLHTYNFGRGINVLEIHTSDKYGNMSQELHDKAYGWLNAGVCIKVFHWPEKEVHDRFVLTDVGGINFGHGLDEFAEGRSAEVLVTPLNRKGYKVEKAKLHGIPSLVYEIKKP